MTKIIAFSNKTNTALHEKFGVENGLPDLLHQLNC